MCFAWFCKKDATQQKVLEPGYGGSPEEAMHARQHRGIVVGTGVADAADSPEPKAIEVHQVKV
jgi:hypothetical protein